LLRTNDNARLARGDFFRQKSARDATGGVWPEAERKLGLELLSGSFKLIYKDKDEAAN
jgi:hypothetical protein